MQVVDTIRAGGFSATSAAAIYDECYAIWIDFAEVSIEYCNRDANQVAHMLAKNAFVSKFSCKWDDEPPSNE